MKKLFNLFILSLILAFASQAQNWQNGNNQGGGGERPTGSLSGKIIDAQTKLPIEYASIRLTNLKDSSLAGGTISDKEGKFLIDKLNFGKYKAKIKFIGFKSFNNANILIIPKKLDIDLGVIALESASQDLEEVTIKGEKEAVKYNLDKKVFTVDQNVTSAGGTVVDIMRTIPSVSVDVDGNVSLRGNSNLTILVDGRPSALTSLDQMPAAMIERIEVVTNPSARYDPDGMAGIINLVLKKQKELGINGMIMVGAGTGGKYNGSANINIRKDKINFFVSADARKFKSKGTNDIARESNINDVKSFLNQNSNDGREGNMQNFKAGLDYFINDKNTFSISGVYNIRAFNSNGDAYNTMLNFNHDTTNYFRNVSENKRAMGGSEYSLDYKKTFDTKGQEFTANAFFSNTHGEFDNNMSQEFFLLKDSIAKQNSETSNRRNNLRLQIDYTQPIGTGRIETGIKNSITDIISDNRFYNIFQNDTIEDVSRYDKYNYNENTSAIYGIYTNIWNKLSYQIGTRFEYTTLKMDDKAQNKSFNRDYFGIFPSAYLKYNFNESHEFAINYSRRINRPNPMQLNPYINYSDPLNLSKGNPEINPEFMNSYEFGYTFSKQQTTFTSTLFYRQTVDVISRYVSLQNNSDTTMSSFTNLGSRSNTGLEVFINQPLTKWWKINASASLFKAEIAGEGVSEDAKTSNSWTAKATSTWSPLPFINLQLMFNYFSPVVTTGGGWHGAMGKNKENYSLDGGARFDFMKGNASLTLRMSDILKTSNHDAVNYGENFVANIKNRHESQVIFVGFTYKFNDYKRKPQKREEQNGNGEEE